MNCPICDSEFVRSLYGKDDMRWECWGYDKHIYECSFCKLRFLYPQWSEKELNHLYTQYHGYSVDFIGQKQAPRITKYLDKYVKPHHIILEIGCGRGENIRRLKEKYPNKVFLGLDKDKDVCDGILTHDIDIMDFNPSHKYHFIYGIQVFEHVAHPLNFLKKIKEILIPGGRFLLEIPNMNDPLVSLYKVESFIRFYNIPYHLFYYNDTNLIPLLTALDFKYKIKRIQKYGILNHLRWICKGVPGNFHPHIPIIDDIYKFILTKILKISDTLIIVGEK